jgi:hypothetical protein
MKICPSCRETYADDQLNFCLKDGSFLTSAKDNEPKTVYMDSPRVTNQNWQQQPTYQPPAVWQNQTNMQNQPGGSFSLQNVGSQDQTLPIISLVLGILSILTVCCWGGIPLGAGAIVTGIIALNKEKADPSRFGGRGLAMGGIITGALAAAVGFGFLILIIVS